MTKMTKMKDNIEELGDGWNKIIEEHKKHSLKPETHTDKEKFEEEKLLELSERISKR